MLERSYQLKNDGQDKLHAKVLGKGEPVLCISGFGCDHYNFEWLKHNLAKNFTCVLLDNRGMGAKL